MKSNIIFAVVALFMISCSQQEEQTAVTTKQPENFIVMLDLSDRLLNPGQIDQDIELVYHLFEKYETSVRGNLIINSKDIFRIVIAPQEGMGINASQIESSFYLDMEKIPIATKRSALDNFKMELKNNLNKLYGEVTKGKTKTSDFQGSDIWKYFNDYLCSDIKKNYNNRLFVLSDGYFDFEPTVTAKKIIGNKSSTSSFLNKIRGNANWKDLIAKNDYGIIPIGKKYDSLAICLMEINPKHPNLDETDMIKYIWEKWLGEMNIQDAGFLIHSSIPKMKGQIDNWIQ
jgi:hypothetical protein